LTWGKGRRVNKKDFSERDICTKFITPAIKQAGWDLHSQVREEVGFTKGRIIVRGKLVRSEVYRDKATS
jgi:type I restriction enzyme, R subunit